MRPLVPPYVETLKAYVPGKPIEETEREYGLKGVIKLASNENPLGPSPRAVEAMRNAAAQVHLYPDATSFHLVRKLAAHLGVKPEEVVLGSGSNELIELLMRTFTTPEEEILLCKGSFPAYRISAQAHGRAFVEVPMREGFRYDLEAMARAVTPRTRMVFLANPDNPTGTTFGRKDLEKFLAAVPKDVLVVHDEAYAEFVDWPDYASAVELFHAHPNLVGLRTFSKIHGLAGIRLGSAVMDAKLAGYVHRTRMPFNLTTVAQAAGMAALEDTEHVKHTRENNRVGLRFYGEELPKLGLTLTDSHANFVFVDCHRPSAEVYEQLLRRGVIVRPMAGNGHPNCLRISVGSPEENARCVAALKEVLS
ncbi:histidinol-phosphate transaminase [Corallococcus exiguus]|uniref:Histidinol-phosphate aminotransferase n=1 Tax=Corallococcus exiguus TaxID=83462 RepID=A0A7X4YDP8_9BACT|nr:histidinol-phosphate transaminase [Corallococcus exiguus]NBC43553.1 histidinol-phosphate transaminase [Corallococcus exiguus]TNV51749.1 histidinol-phosphate transaminase [Corallococcus exiguus]